MSIDQAPKISETSYPQPLSPKRVNSSHAFPIHRYSFLEEHELTAQAHSTNRDYIDIASKRANLLQTAIKLEQSAYNVDSRDYFLQKKTITQFEYSVTTAEGETRYFFVKPERILCQQEESMFNVHRYFTSVGKPAFSSQIYPTSSMYHSPSPLPDATPESVRPEVIPESVSLDITPESVRPEATPPPLIDSHIACCIIL